MGIEDPVEKYDPTKENDPSGVKAPREKSAVIVHGSFLSAAQDGKQDTHSAQRQRKRAAAQSDGKYAAHNGSNGKTLVIRGM